MTFRVCVTALGLPGFQRKSYACLPQSSCLGAQGNEERHLKKDKHFYGATGRLQELHFETVASDKLCLLLSKLWLWNRLRSPGVDQDGERGRLSQWRIGAWDRSPGADAGRGGVERRDTLTPAATSDAHTRRISGPEWIGPGEVTFTLCHTCVHTQDAHRHMLPLVVRSRTSPPAPGTGP